MRRSVAALVPAAAIACAQPGTPPGGEPDNTPPRVIAVEPAAYDTVRALDEPVVFRFDERISERLEGVAEIRDAVVVSPLTSPIEARRRRRSIEVSLIRDWEPGRVYTVEVRPLFRDLFGNQRVEPIRLVFSTGAAIPETAIAGFVVDRLTREPAAGARVEARRTGEPAPWVAIADSSGFFALRHLEPGDYRLTAWLDQDRDREPDFQEARDSAGVAIAAGDTAVLELAVVPGDSTAARLARAEAVDSLRVRLLFDDYFAVGEITGAATLLRADSTRVSTATLIHGARLDSILAAESRDTAGVAPADSLAGDTTAPRPGRAVGGREERPGLAGAASPSDRPLLPSQALIALLPGPLTPDSTYVIRVRGVTNIQGVPGGGGTAEFEAPPQDTTPPPQDTVLPTPADTVLPTPPDTTSTPGDTTVAPPPDTTPPPAPEAPAGEPVAGPRDGGPARSG